METDRRFARYILIALVACLGLSLTGAVPADAAIGRNGWYWPTGHNASNSGGSWLQHRFYSSGGEAWHVAWDDMSPAAYEPVYSLGWGVVEFADMHVDGYGWSNGRIAPGGAVVIRYRSQGTTGPVDFKALYGHLDFAEADLPVGSKVRPGQVFAVTNAYSTSPHVHFGLHPGSDDPASSVPGRGYVGMLMGHTHDYTLSGTIKRAITYGWVDPVLFLNTHTPYVPPAASLSAPAVQRVVRARSAFRASGTMTPSAGSSPRTVSLQCERLENGTWVRRAAWTGVCRDGGAGTSAWTITGRLPSPGQWRMRAVTEGDLDWGPGQSDWVPVTAR